MFIMRIYFTLVLICGVLGNNTIKQRRHHFGDELDILSGSDSSSRSDDLSRSKTPKSSDSSSSSVSDVTELFQNDFDAGTFRITTSGEFILGEDIEFNPNPDDDFLPTAEQLDSTHPFPEFQGGFIAAITVETDNVIIDCNGNTLGCSDAFMLMQRAPFALIGLASFPYVPPTGPLVGIVELRSASNIIIRNCKLGPSSHHGIHGNGNSNVNLLNLDIFEYEIAGIHLNGAVNVNMKNIDIHDTRTDIPVIGTFTSDRTIQVGLNSLNQSLELTFADRVGEFTVTEVLDNIRKQQQIIFDTVILGLDVSNDPLFDASMDLYFNPTGFPDGSAAYGIVINRFGAAVGGFGADGFGNIPSDDIMIKNVDIRNIQSDVREIIALFKNTAIVGFSAELFQIERVSSNINDFNDNFYIGNALSDAHITLAKFSDEVGVKLGRLNIPEEIMKWGTTSGLSLADAITNEGVDLDDYSFHLNGDHQFHVVKGPVGIRIDFVENLIVRDVNIENIVNIGPQGSDINGFYTDFASGGHPGTSNSGGYEGTFVRGLSYVQANNVDVKNVKIANLISENGIAIPIDIMANVDIKLNKFCSLSSAFSSALSSAL